MKASFYTKQGLFVRLIHLQSYNQSLNFLSCQYHLFHLPLLLSQSPILILIHLNLIQSLSLSLSPNHYLLHRFLSQILQPQTFKHHIH
jgi:hypothetical protein